MEKPSDYSVPLTKHFTGRLRRSLENPLRLLHRSDSNFFILGATGKVYTVTLSTTPTCNCPDPTTPCKHILFLYIRVLSLPLNDRTLRCQTLSPSQLTRLLSAEASDEAFAGSFIRERFRELYRERKARSNVTVEAGSKCSVCLEEMGVDDRKVVACAACKNPIHEKCVICQARWREIGEEGEYINLSAYLSDDDDDEDRRRRRRR